MDNILVVKNADNQDLAINVIDIIEDTSTNKQYIYYALESGSDVYLSRLIEQDDSYTLEKVTEEERQSVENALNEGIE